MPACGSWPAAVPLAAYSGGVVRSVAGLSPPYRLTIPAHPLPGFPQAERICLPYSLVKMRFMVKRIETGFPARRNTLPAAARFCRMESSRVKIIRGISKLKSKDSGI